MKFCFTPGLVVERPGEYILVGLLRSYTHAGEWPVWLRLITTLFRPARVGHQHRPTTRLTRTLSAMRYRHRLGPSSGDATLVEAQQSHRRSNEAVRHAQSQPRRLLSRTTHLDATTPRPRTKPATLDRECKYHARDADTTPRSDGRAHSLDEHSNPTRCPTGCLARIWRTGSFDGV